MSIEIIVPSWSFGKITGHSLEVNGIDNNTYEICKPKACVFSLYGI